jgi:hypothetical protein
MLINEKKFLKYFLQIVCAKPSIDMGQCQITKRPKISLDLYPRIVHNFGK